MEIADFIRDVKGFALSAALIAATDADLFDSAASKPRPSGELCESVGWNEEIGAALLDVLRANGYLTESDGKLRISDAAAPLVHQFQDLKPWTREMALTFASLAELSALARSGDVAQTALSNFWAYKGRKAPEDLTGGDVLEYSDVMDASQTAHARAVLDVLDLGRYPKVVDLGGGFGGFARQVVARAPGTSVIVVDLPAVAEEAATRHGGGPDDRIEFHGCDAFREELPEADAVVLNRVLHDWPDGKAIQLLRQARHALRHGGRVIVAEHIDQQSDVLGPSSAATRLMLTLLGGKRRTVEQMHQLHDVAGLEVERVIPTSHSLTTVIVSSPR